MPSPNTVKEFDAPAYYHVYNRGAGKQAIFRDSIDHKKLTGEKDEPFFATNL